MDGLVISAVLDTEKTNNYATPIFRNFKASGTPVYILLPRI